MTEEKRLGTKESPSIGNEHSSASITPAERGFNISAWSINHPYTIGAFYLGMILLAIVAIGFYMPKRLMPYVESPMVAIVTMQPGLSAEEMETYISKPIEERMVDIRGVRFIRSSSQEGFSMVSLEFPYGTDMKRAEVEVEALLTVVQADMPATGANLKPSWVLLIDPLNLPVLTYNVKGEGWDPVKLRQLADNEITDRLKRIPKVWSIYSFGGYKRQLGYEPQVAEKYSQAPWQPSSPRHARQVEVIAAERVYVFANER